MAWLRVGDSIATHPLMSRLTEACNYDHSLKLEAFGLFTSLATVAAGHLTDYVVEPGLVGQFAPGREKALLDVLRESTLVENFKADDGRWLYKLKNDEEFVHMRTKKEVELDRNRKRDARNPELIIPVRVRDGDVCRWCGKTVNFADRKSARGGTIDSLNDHADSTVETLVVACHGCNSSRHDQQSGEWKLRPEPTRTEVYYSQATIKYINQHDWSKAHGITIEDRQTRLNLEAPAAAAGQDQSQRQDAARGGGGAPGGAARETAAAAQDADPDPAAAGSATQPDEQDEPEWMTRTVEPNRIDRQQDAARGDGGAPGGAARETAAAAQDADPDPAAAPAPEDNETVKPNSDQIKIKRKQGDDQTLSGSGRVGSGRDGPGLEGSSRFGKGRRRRGKRGGRKR